MAELRNHRAGNGRMRVVCFKIDADLLERLDRIAALDNASRSMEIRRAIERYVRIMEEKLSPQPRIVRIG